MTGPLLIEDALLAARLPEAWPDVEAVIDATAPMGELVDHIEALLPRWHSALRRTE